MWGSEAQARFSFGFGGIVLIVDGVSCNITSCCPAHFVLTHTHLSVKSVWLCVCAITDGGGSISASRVNLKSVLCVFMHMCVYKERLVVYNCLQPASVCVCVLDHKGHLVVRWLLPDSVFCLFVCVHGFFITSSRKLSQPSLRAHPGWRSFPTSHHAHPHSAQFTLLLPLDLDGLMLGWGNASKGSAFLTSDPNVSFICRSALCGCGVCVFNEW